jgi:murein L,D-transpeptidase YcbB/YkuD
MTAIATQAMRPVVSTVHGVRATVLLVAMLVIAPVLHAIETPVTAREDLRRLLEDLHGDGPRAADLGIAAVRILPELYERRDFEFLWTADMAAVLMAAIDDSESHGLLPSDAHREALASRMRGGDTLGATFGRDAELELLLSDAFLRLAYTLHFGKLDPVDTHPEWNFERSLTPDGSLPVIEYALSRGDISGFLARVAPQGPIYAGMRSALARYRELAAAGGWPSVPPGDTLEEGSRGPRVAALRARLEVADPQLSKQVADRELFDADLADAVRRFQTAHGLDVDAKVGPGTVADLNVSAAERIDQLRANLERVRWVFPGIGDDFLVVNIAGYRLYLVRGRQLVWTTRVQVGKPYHQTPVFRDEITYLVLNPTWTVPPGILRNETLPAIRKDSSYLVKQNMTVVDRSGRAIDPATLDWNASFPYFVRQEPGPNNSLGRVKFMFPNPYMVYLHDTPSRRLFDRADRTFSHGCIRVEDPLRLAEMLLATTPGWDRDAIDRALTDGATRTVTLANPMPVMLLYFTAEVDAEGHVNFYRDPYDRDRAVIDGLGEPFRPPAVGAGG